MLLGCLAAMETVAVWLLSLLLLLLLQPGEVGESLPSQVLFNIC